MPKPRLAISLGDPAGIGPEVVAKALRDPEVAALARYTVYGSAGALRRVGGLPPGIVLVEPAHIAAPDRVPGHTDAAGGRDSLAFLDAAIADVQGSTDPARAIVTAPISKEAWALAGAAHPGHTEHLAERFASPHSGMLFVGPSLRVILATIHAPVRDVPRLLTQALVFEKIVLGEQACRALGVARPRVAVAGLNPHAGEHGLFGDEDARLIAPAVAQARAQGLDATGPVPGDAVFLAAVRGAFDLVVAMYHDQGLIPVKLLDREHTVNVTVGLRWQGRPVVRTSPAHGTAFDIAGQDRADPASMKAAIRLAVRMLAAAGPA